MKYPKAVMTIKELKAMGFSEAQLRAAFHNKLNEGKRYAWRISDSPKSTIYFDTEEFDKVRRFV